MPKFGGYDFALVVTCGLTRFTRVFPCTKHITGEETIKILLEEWFCVYGAPKEINSDQDVRVRSDTGWYKRVLRSLNVQVSTGIPYSHTSNPLCERQIRVLKENVRIWCKTERTRDWVRLLPVISLMMNSQESLATGYSPHELFLGRPAWFLHAPVSAANPHLLRFSQICPRLATFWSFSLLRRNRRPAAQSQDQTYIFLMCRI